MNVGIYIYPQAEVLDFSGPFEVFATATRLCREHQPFNVFLVGQTGKAIAARGGYMITPNYAFDNHPPIDVLLVVGGVHTEELAKAEVIAWISARAANAKLIASVCTGAFLLAQAKVVTNQRVTTHWEDIGELKRMFPGLTLVENVRWVEQGNLITSAGISAGIDMCLHLVARLHSVDLAISTARQMDYSWNKNPSC